MRITIQPSALADLKRGFLFYESKEKGLGDYFIDSIYSDIDSLQLYGGIHSIHFSRFHRLLSKRFPYGIYYQVSGGVVMVNAILDLRQSPNKLGSMLENLP